MTEIYLKILHQGHNFNMAKLIYSVMEWLLPNWIFDNISCKEFAVYYKWNGASVHNFYFILRKY